MTFACYSTGWEKGWCRGRRAGNRYFSVPDAQVVVRLGVGTRAGLARVDYIFGSGYPGADRPRGSRRGLAVRSTEALKQGQMHDSLRGRRMMVKDMLSTDRTLEGGFSGEREILARRSVPADSLKCPAGRCSAGMQDDVSTSRRAAALRKRALGRRCPNRDAPTLSCSSIVRGTGGPACWTAAAYLVCNTVECCRVGVFSRGGGGGGGRS